MEVSEQLATDAEEENFVRACVRDLGKNSFFEEADSDPRDSFVALLLRVDLDILHDIIRRPMLMQKAVQVLEDMNTLDILKPYIDSK